MDPKLLAILANAIQTAKNVKDAVQLSHIKEDVEAFIATLSAELGPPPNGVEWTDADLKAITDGIRAEADHVLDSRRDAGDEKT